LREEHKIQVFENKVLKDDVLLGSEAVWTGWEMPTFGETCCLHSPTSPHGTRIQKNITIIVTAVKTSNLTKCSRLEQRGMKEVSSSEYYIMSFVIYTDNIIFETQEATMSGKVARMESTKHA
jgi:hypothetical protein